MKYLHTMIRIKDVDESLRFFCEGLGLKETRRMENEKGRFTLIFLAAPNDNNAEIELTYNWDGDELGDGSRNFGHLAYRVDNIYETCQRLMDMGYTINRPPRDGHMAFVRSPDKISIESLKKGAQRLTSTVIEQRTPTRVSHRRADLVRPRLVNSVDVISFTDGMAELVIRAQHGTYIRELVSGDDGRTVPSLTSLIDAKCKVEVLDVLNLHLQAKEEKND